MSNNVYSAFDLARGLQPPHADVRGMAIEEYKRRHGGHADKHIVDAIDNATEASFRDDMLGRFTNMNTAFEGDSPYLRSLTKYYGVNLSKTPEPIQGILSGSASGTAETNRKWAKQIVDLTEAKLSPLDAAIFQKRYEDEPWKRYSYVDVAMGEQADGTPSGMQETDVDPSKSGFFNTFYHRALQTPKTRDDFRERELPSRVTHDMTTKVLEPGNVGRSLMLDPMMAFE